MYLAVKWLIGQAFVLWISLCSIDIITKVYKINYFNQPFDTGSYKNVTQIVEKLIESSDSLKQPLGHATTFRHFIMFITGAIAMLIYNKRKEFLLLGSYKNFYQIKMYFTTVLHKNSWHEGADYVLTTSTKYFWLLYNLAKTKLKDVLEYLKKYLSHQNIFDKPKVHLMMLQKLKEIDEERENLACLLISALEENKNLRTQCQLESRAKIRLQKQLKNAQKSIKENRFKYVNFQQLYMITHQENLFLKANIKKVRGDKDIAETNLMKLVTEIFHTKNNELKMYCSRFVVKTENNLLNADVEAEIKRFLEHKISDPIASTSEVKISEMLEVKDINLCVADSVHEIDDKFCDAPRLKGLPGEYVWTVKDKNGLIEKLYECDYGTDYSNGDTIRRIREYTVFYDKDCLLDYKRSKTAIEGDDSFVQQQYLNTPPVMRRRLVTSSEAFQNFLKNSKDIVSSSFKTSAIH